MKVEIQPSKFDWVVAKPKIMAVGSIIANGIGGFLFARNSFDIKEKLANAETKKEKRKEILKAYGLPLCLYFASSACTLTLGLDASGDISALASALVVADYKLRESKKEVEGPFPHEFKNGVVVPKDDEVLIYDEYLETLDQDGYYAYNKADWLEHYADFLTKYSAQGFASFADFYETFPVDSVPYAKMINLGPWSNYASWDICDWDTIAVACLQEEDWIDEETRYYNVRWFCPPEVNVDFIADNM